MLYFLIDDERLALNSLKKAVEEADSTADIQAFSDADVMLDAFKEGARPDLAFLDVEMPEVNGIILAKMIRELSPSTKIVFVTAFSEYALKAFSVHARGYLMKPVTAKMIKEQLNVIFNDDQTTDSKLHINCFGNFEVFKDGKPVYFQRSKCKELLALLVDRRGARLSTKELASVLFPDSVYDSSVKNKVNVIVSSLRKTLENIDMKDLMIKEHNSLAVDKSLIVCDYYGFLEGDPGSINHYMGEYMTDYSWADFTNKMLLQKTNLGQ